MKNQAKKSEVVVDKWLQKRLARAGKNPKLIAALSKDDIDDRWDALRAAGFCGYAGGSCDKGPNGTVAEMWKDENGKKHVECEFHTKAARKWAKAHAPKAEPKAAKKTKVIALPPTKKAVDNIAKALAATRERKAAGPKPQ
jgi:hypothetical protein